MICPNCGKENPEGNAACFSCGADLPVTPATDAAQPTAAAPVAATAVPAGAVHFDPTPVQPAAAQQAQPAADAQPQAQPAAASAAQSAACQQAAPQGQPQAQPQAAPYQQAAPQGTPYQQAAPQSAPYQAAPQPQPQAVPYQQAVPQQPAAQVYKKGCVASAWDDIKNSDGWAGRTALLGLVNLVPILNWAVPGYCMRWARQLPMGTIAPMPKGIFVNRGFINGVYWFVLTLVISLVCGIASGIVGIVPLLGWIAALAISIFAAMFMNVAIMRTAVADRLGAGFDISAIWAALKKNPGSLLFISLVPGLIVGACLGIIMLIIFGIAAIGVGGDIINLAYLSSDYGYGYGYGGYGYDASGAAAAMAVLGMIGKMIPAILVSYVISAFATAFLYVLEFRAMGHWTARYAADWMTDPAVQATANMYPDQA